MSSAFLHSECEGLKGVPNTCPGCAGNYEAVEPALASLEALGPALESHLQLLLPALVRLICPGARP